VIDVYFSTMDYPSELAIREAMSDQCRERWMKERVPVKPLWVPASNPVEFQRTRRIHADQYAGSPIYVLADDDCLLGEESPIAPMLDLMARYPEFAILSLLPSSAPIYPWTPEGYTPVLNEEIMEHVSVGCIRFCRKGAMKDWPPMDGPGYDGIHCQALRDAGWRVGYARQHTMVHLGERLSTVWEAHKC
jgi:hypothetical protein